MKKILIVLTNHDVLGASGKKTGCYLSELTHFYSILKKAGYNMDFVSPKGGEVPLDPGSMNMKDSVNKEYIEDPEFLSKLRNSFTPEQVRPEDYDAIYYPGGHGPMWDLANNTALARITGEIYENKGIVSAVCHGVAGLLPVVLSDGKHLLHRKKVTGFSNMEERLVRKDKWVPFLLETALRKHAEKYTKHLLPGFSHVEADGRLVTGQNPNSTKQVAEETVRALQAL